MCVDIYADQSKAVGEGNCAFFCRGVLCLGVGLRQETPDPRRAHYVLTPWPCVKGLCLWHVGLPVSGCVCLGRSE